MEKHATNTKEKTLNPCTLGKAITVGRATSQQCLVKSPGSSDLKTKSCTRVLQRFKGLRRYGAQTPTRELERSSLEGRRTAKILNLETNVTKRLQRVRYTPTVKARKLKLDKTPSDTMRDVSDVKSTDASSQCTKEEEVKHIKSQIDLPVKVRCVKTNIWQPYHLRDAIKTLKRNSSVIEEGKPAVVHHHQTVSRTKTRTTVKIGSDLTEEMEFEVLEEDQIHTEYEPNVEEEDDMIKSPCDSYTEYETGTDVKPDEPQKKKEPDSLFRDSKRETNGTRENNEASAEVERLKQALKVQEDKLTLMARLNSEMEHKLVKTETRSRKSRRKVKKLNSLNGALEYLIGDMHHTRKKADADHEASMKLQQEELETVKERLKIETSLREELGQKLEKNAEYFTRSDAELSRLMKLTDPHSRHPYPRRDESPTKIEMFAWLDAKKARTELAKERENVAQLCAERDELSNTVSKFLLSKHIELNDPDVPFIVVKEKTMKALEGDVERLTRDLGERTAQGDKWKKEAACLQATLDLVEGNADSRSALRENYLLNEKMKELNATNKCLLEDFKSIETILWNKMMGIEQRDCFMVELCAAYDAHQKMVELLAERKETTAAMVAQGRQRRGGDGDGEAGRNGSTTSIISLLSGVGSRICRFVGYGNSPSSSPHETTSST